MKRLTDYVVFNDEKLARKYSDAPIPMSVLYEAYFDGDIDVVGDIEDLLRDRAMFVKYTITRQHLQWAVKNYVPDMAAHTRTQDEKLVREVYDRGNDFFQWFLGESMVYTTGLFRAEEDSLEQAQHNQLQQIANKLQLKSGERLLDIGCGWGTLITDFSKQYGVEATGITLAQAQTDFANRQIAKAGVAERARVVRQDYRDLDADTKYDKIVCLEMIEHVGLKNLTGFCERVVEVLADDGLFLLQWTGLRRALKPEDMIWGLFMNKYIFPGADAALSPSAMLKPLEKSGFEVHSVENLSGHYATTLGAWRRNWTRNKSAVLAAYGDRWYRIWNFFLAWSVLVAEQGNASCYQAVLNKNLDSFNRHRWDAVRRSNSRLREEPVAPESTERTVTSANGTSANGASEAKGSSAVAVELKKASAE